MLAARHRARLAMEEGGRDNDEERPKRCGIRRKLFIDDDDNNENNDEIKKNEMGKLDNETNRFIEETRKDLDNAKERWNFDFQKEEPLPGRYEWVKVNERFSQDNSNKNSSSDINISRNISNILKEDAVEINPSLKD